MNANEISFENLPKAVAFLSHQIEELKTIVKNKDTIEINNKKIPISIDQACTIIKKAKPTVYTLVRKRQIPHYKNGKKLYFYEDELLDWIAQGKRKTIQEIDEIAHKTEKRFK